MELAYYLRLDAATLIFSISVVALCMATVVFGMARAIKKHGLEQWGIAMSCASVAFLLYFLRGKAPLFLTYLLANGFMLAATIFSLMAYARVLEVPSHRKTIAVGTTVAMSALVMVSMFGASAWLGVFSVNMVLATHNFLGARMVLQGFAGQRAGLAWSSVAAFCLLGITFAARAVWSTMSHAPSLDVSVNTLPQVGAFLMGGLFVALSTVGFVAMVSERLRRETEGRLRRDGLTGLLSRTALFEETRNIDQFGLSHDYCVVMLDIDHFKSVNDRYGHSGGDLALAHVARLIAGSVRISDLAARYGGEEFCVLLRDCTQAQAAGFAQRLVADVGRQAVRLRDGRDVQVTISAGYAYKSATSGPAGTGSSERLEDVIDRADKALYLAKHGGRNQAVAAHGWPLAAAA